MTPAGPPRHHAPMPTAAASTHDRCQTDLAALVAALNLQGTPGVTGNVGSNVFTQAILDEAGLKFPCVVVAIEDEAETEEEGEGNFEQDGVAYPVRVLICDRVSARYQDARADYLRWRHAIARRIRDLATYPLLPNVGEAWTVTIRPLKVFDPRLPQYQFLVSGLVAVVHCTEDRQRDV